jgi:hypothetical protein
MPLKRPASLSTAENPSLWRGLVMLLCSKVVMSQTAAQTAISDTAAEYGLGRPRPESLQALQTPVPRSEGWWQAFNH